MCRSGAPQAAPRTRPWSPTLARLHVSSSRASPKSPADGSFPTPVLLPITPRPQLHLARTCCRQFDRATAKLRPRRTVKREPCRCVRNSGLCVRDRRCTGIASGIIATTTGRPRNTALPTWQAFPHTSTKWQLIRRGSEAWPALVPVHPSSPFDSAIEEASHSDRTER